MKTIEKIFVPLISRNIGVPSPYEKTTLSWAHGWEASVVADLEYSPYVGAVSNKQLMLEKHMKYYIYPSMS